RILATTSQSLLHQRILSYAFWTGSRATRDSVSIASSSANTLLQWQLRYPGTQWERLNRFFISEYSLTTLQRARSSPTSIQSQSLLHQRILSYVARLYLSTSRQPGSQSLLHQRILSYMKQVSPEEYT